jgi:hypothetical protein
MKLVAIVAVGSIVASGVVAHADTTKTAKAD